MLAIRVERKLHVKGLQGSVLNRIFVAYPTPRDDKVRAPYVPQAFVEKNNSVMDVVGIEAQKRKTERDLHQELGNAYNLDLRKNYLLKNSDEKYDIVPEIWEGHNIADFVDPEVLLVLFTLRIFELIIFCEFRN